MGNLNWVNAFDNLNLLGTGTAKALADLAASDDTELSTLAHEALVAPIDPELSDTEILTEYYGLDLALSCNCVLVAGKREGNERSAAVVIRATTRADINHSIRQLLDVRKCSFWPQSRAVEESGMEYGGITPIGLPHSWRLLLDERVSEGWCIIGSGVRASKLAVPGALLTRLPGAEVIHGLAFE